MYILILKWVINKITCIPFNIDSEEAKLRKLNVTEITCGFPLAEKRKKRKTFFSHTAGCLGTGLRGVSGHICMCGSAFNGPNEYSHCNYYALNSLSLFWLAESIQWIFEISACDVISADYTIIMSRSWVIVSRSQVIISSLCALCCLPSVKKQKHDFHFFSFNAQCIIKQLLLD